MMAKGHKKIAGSYCYKGNGCTSRFCEFCCNGDKYEEIEIEDEEIEDEMIEERLDELIQMYESEINKYRESSDYTKTVVKIKSCHSGVTKMFCENVVRIACIKILESVVDSLKYAKTGERK